MVLLDELAVLVKSGRADDAEFVLGEKRLHQVSGIHGSAVGFACTYERVDLIYEQYNVGVIYRFIEHVLDAVFEVTSVLGTCDHRTHVHAVYGLALYDVRHVAFCDLKREAFSDRRLTYTRITDEAGVVLCAASKDLHDAVDLFFSSDHRIDLAGLGCLRKILTELIESLVAALSLLCSRLLGTCRTFGAERIAAFVLIVI